MILFDTETTGLVQPEAIPLHKQPQIIEFCAIKLDDKTLKETGMIDELVDPGIPLPPEIVRITGITDSMLKGKAPFGALVSPVIEFVLGERIICAHNADFDCRLLAFELQRLDLHFRFPWPPKRVCTIEASMSIKRHRLKLGELYEMATGRKLEGAHRAINDVRGLAECVRWLRKKGLV